MEAIASRLEAGCDVAKVSKVLQISANSEAAHLSSHDVRGQHSGRAEWANVVSVWFAFVRLCTSNLYGCLLTGLPLNTLVKGSFSWGKEAVPVTKLEPQPSEHCSFPVDSTLELC